MDLQLPEDDLEVVSNRVRTDGELLGDLTSRGSRAHLLDNLGFARRQLRLQLGAQEGRVNGRHLGNGSHRHDHLVGAFDTRPRGLKVGAV